MITLYESILSDIDTQLDKGGKEAESIEMLESFKKWLTNGYGGIIIDFDDTPVAETIIKKCKAYINKIKRTGELKSAQDVNDAILKVIDDELSLSTIDKNWKGIMRIVFNDRGQNFTMGNGIMIVPRLIKSGDLCIQRAPHEKQWSVQQRIINV